MGVLDLPRITPHGYGIPQILSAWDEKRQEMGAAGIAATKAKQEKELFDLNKKNIESQIAEREALRQNKVLAEVMSLVSTSEKLMKDPRTFETGLAMNNIAYGNMNKIFPDLKLDVSGISDAAERRKEASKQVTAKLYDLYESASSSQDPKQVSQLKRYANQALNNGFINDDAAKFFMDVKPKEARVLSPRDAAFERLTPEEQKKVLLGDTSPKQSRLSQLIKELSSLPDEDPNRKIYEDAINKEAGRLDIDPDTMTQEEVDTWGAYINLTGKVPPLGMGKQAAALRVRLLKSAARQTLGENIPEGSPKQTPSEAALSMLTKQSDTKAIQGSLNFLDKQISSMGSFVDNIDLQVNKVKELSKDLETFDARLLNIPLRAIRGRIVGSALQAKYDMYLTEIENEIGKLATGSTSSIAELSTTAQEKWSKIHDKNLSTKDMLSLLEETRNAADMRLGSIEGQLQKTRKRMVNRGNNSNVKNDLSTMSDDELLRSLNAN